MVFYLFSQLFSYSLSLSNDCLSIWLYHILQDNTYKSQKSVWINKKSIANAMLFSLCRWRDFLLSYRTVHRTVLPNFYGFALKFGTTSSSLSLYLKNKSTEKRCFLPLAQMKGFEPLKRCSPFTRFPIVLLRPARTHLHIILTIDISRYF